MVEGTLLLDDAEPVGAAARASVQIQRPKALRRAKAQDPLDAAYPPELDDPLSSLPTQIDDALPPELQLVVVRVGPLDRDRALPPELRVPPPPPPAPDLNAPLPRHYDATVPGPMPPPTTVDPTQRDAPLPPDL